LGLLPSVLAPKAYRARQRVTAAFAEYHKKKLETQANAYMKASYEVMDKYKLDKIEDMARFNIGTIYATITNTVPTAFWMLSFVLGDEELKKVISGEVEGVVSLEDDRKRIVLDVDGLNETKCPVLTSSFWETLRMVNAGTSIRWVEEDIVVDGYLLKKGAVVQMPAGVLQY